MPINLAGLDKGGFYNNKRIKMIYLGGTLKYQYDNVAPTLSVGLSGGDTYSSPIYTPSSTFVITGLVSDSDSGVAAVYVNGSAADIDGTIWSKTISLSANKVTTVKIYAVDHAGNKSATFTKYVEYITVAPTIVVATPSGTISSPTYIESSEDSVVYTVSGTVSDTNSSTETIMVNGQRASYDGENWSIDMSFASNKPHVITIVATNAAGLTTVVRRCLYVVSSLEAATRQVMSYVYVGANGVAKKVAAVDSALCESVLGSDWRDEGHELVITYATKCVPTSLTFTTPKIVNSGQASSVTYSIYGSNSAFNGTLSNMVWTELVSNATWTQPGEGNTIQTLQIPTNGQAFKHIRMTTTWFYGANNYHGVDYGDLHTNASVIINGSSLEDSVIFDSGEIQDGVQITKLKLDGDVIDETDAICMNSNPNKIVSLQPYSAIGVRLNGYSKYQHINVDYKDWEQTGNTSSARFAVCEDLNINLGSTNREWTSSIASTYAKEESGTLQLPWTDDNYVGIGAFSQSNQNASLRVTKIYFSDPVTAPYNDALSLVGMDEADSLNDVLANADTCYALAENIDAIDIMKKNYAEEITSAVDSNWNEGLNLLAYQCKLKCYIIKDRVGVNNFHETTSGITLTGHTETNNDKFCAISSTNPINVVGYTTCHANGYLKSSYGVGTSKFGLSAHSVDEIGYSDGKYRGYDMYYKDNSGVEVDNDVMEFEDKMFQITDISHVYPFISMSLPLSNTYSQTGTAYFTDLILIP